MQSFTSLNTPEFVEFEDLRLPNIKTDVPRAFDTDFTETVGEFPVYREIEIVELVRPELLNLRYKIEVTTQVEGAIPEVVWSPTPSGVTIFASDNTYIVSGIDTLAKWNAVKNPVIRINDFLGNFSYSVSIIYFNGTADEEIRWTVGTYVPASLMPAEFTQITDAALIREVSPTLLVSSSLTATPFTVIPIQLDPTTVSSSFSLTAEGMEVKATPAVLNSTFTVNAVPTVISNLTLTTLHTIQPANDIFQSGLDITDTYAVVGAVGSSVLSVYSPVNGQLLRTIPRPNTDFSRLGFVVSIQGNTVTASHDYLDGGSTKPVYQFNLTNGNLIRTIPSPDAISFGLSMDTSPLYTIVGTGSGTGNNAYIYENSTGNLLHTLSVSGKKLRACTINDNYAVVSAFDGTACYVYNPSTGNLLFTINHPSFNALDEDQFGQVITLRGRYLAVSAPNRDFGTTTDGLDSGVVYLFDMETNGTLLRTFLNPNVGGTRRNDRFGQALSIQGNYMMVGAFQEDVEGTFLENKNRGAVYTYNLLTGNLMQTLVGTNDFQGFGWRVALSENYAAVNDQLPVGSGNTAFRIYTVT